jgi:hypothetical protein
MGGCLLASPFGVMASFQYDSIRFDGNMRAKLLACPCSSCLPGSAWQNHRSLTEALAVQCMWFVKSAILLLRGVKSIDQQVALCCRSRTS